jgi:hypothetical protein
MLKCAASALNDFRTRNLEFLGSQTVGDMAGEQEPIQDPLILEQQPVRGARSRWPDRRRARAMSADGCRELLHLDYGSMPRGWVEHVAPPLRRSVPHPEFATAA